MKNHFFKVIALALVLVSQTCPFTIYNNTGLTMTLELGWFSNGQLTHMTKTEVGPDSQANGALPAEFEQVAVVATWLEDGQEQQAIVMLAPAEYEPIKVINDSCLLIIFKNSETGDLTIKLLGKELAQAIASQMVKVREAVEQQLENAE